MTRAIMSRGPFLTVCLLMLALAAMGQEEEPGLAATGASQGPAKAQLELRYSKGDAARYRFTQTSFVALKGVQGLGVPSGQPFEIQAKGLLFEKLIGITDEGNYEIKAGFENAVVLQAQRALSFAGEDLPNAIVVLGKLGNLVATTRAYPGIPAIANQPWTSQVRPPSSWVVFSGKEVAPGSKWTAEVPVPLPGAEAEQLKIKVSYEVDGFEQMQGSDCARILMTASGPLEAKGVTVYGSPVDLALDFSITATAWVRTSDGRLVRIDESGRQSMVGTPAARGEGESQSTQIEMGIEGSVTVELIPRKG